LRIYNARERNTTTRYNYAIATVYVVSVCSLLNFDFEVSFDQGENEESDSVWWDYRRSEKR